MEVGMFFVFNASTSEKQEHSRAPQLKVIRAMAFVKFENHKYVN